MAALQQAVGGLPLDSTATRKTFADVLASTPTVSSPPSDPYQSDPLKLGLHKGQPAAFFTDVQLTGLSHKYAWSLVGKFSQGYNKNDPKKGRPSLDSLHKYFLSMDFRGEFSLGLLDNRHVIIHLSHENDYLRLYSRMVWYIGAVTMRIFRWSPYFRVDKESPLVPVWIKLPRLPIMLFEKRTLFSLASLIGRPLRCDAATDTLKRPSVARIQIELDLLKARPSQIWIGLGEHDGYWQQVEYEFLPDYCQNCWHVGHSETVCRVGNPEPKQPSADSQQVPGKVKQVYVPKLSSEVAPADLPTPVNTNESEPARPIPADPSSKKPIVAQEVGFAPVIIQESHPPGVPGMLQLPGPVNSSHVLVDSDPEVDEIISVEDPPISDSALIDQLPAGPNFASQVQDDFLIGASARLYSLSALRTRSARSLPMSPVVLAELRAFGASLQGRGLVGSQPRKRGRPPKVSGKAAQSTPHLMITRSQSTTLNQSSNEVQHTSLEC